MTTTHRSTSEDPNKCNLPLFLITLPRNENSQDIFKLTGLCHISIRVEAYKNQTGLTQCYNCQKFVHANCNQPSPCMCCGCGHLHKECPEKANNTSAPASASACWQTERNPTCPSIEAAATQRKRSAEGSHKEHQRPQREGRSLLTTQHQVCPSRRL
jgi:hypothetical protein